MKKLKYIIFLSGILVITAFSCAKYKIEIDPAKAILGKWEIIEMGNWPDLEPYPATGYIEYLPDSIVRVYEYEKHQFTSQRKYWIDTLLYEYITREDGFQLTIQYKYQFLDNNKLRLDYVDIAAIFNTFIYKRIN